MVISITALVASDRDDNDDRDRSGSYAIGLWGDLPYSTAQEAGVVNLIKDMNKQRLAFTVHDGKEDLQTWGYRFTSHRRAYRMNRG